MLKEYLQTELTNLPLIILSKIYLGTSLVAQWLRIRLPVQGTWVQFLVREDPTCRRATKPTATEPALYSPQATTTEARTPRACAPQREATA